jgi:predicted RNase H-like nuclease (RuvC/YqgF family)
MIDTTTAELARLYRQIKAEDEEIMRLEREMRSSADPEVRDRWLDARQRRRDHNVELLKKLVDLQF